MGKMLGVVAAAAILGAATTAFAAESTHNATGRIKSVDVMRHVITLEGARPRGVNIERVKAGEKVTVTTSKLGGTVEASSITPTVD
jgi:hypothetical protein